MIWPVLHPQTVKRGSGIDFNCQLLEQTGVLQSEWNFQKSLQFCVVIGISYQESSIGFCWTNRLRLSFVVSAILFLNTTICE